METFTKQAGLSSGLVLGSSPFLQALEGQRKAQQAGGRKSSVGTFTVS